mgnify:FL=1|jgi:hypothetical protein
MLKPALVLLCACLPGCVAAIGNTGYQDSRYEAIHKPLLVERVAAAQRIVELRTASLEQVRALQQEGKATASDAWQAEILLEEAKLVLLDCRAALQSAESRKKD